MSDSFEAATLGIAAALQATGPLALHAVPGVCVDALVDAPATALLNHAWLALSGTSEDTARALPDGNRGAILVDATCTFASRTWCIAIKGVGGRAPMYGNTPIGFAHAHEFEGALEAAPLIHAITRESWMGESPYGGQGIENALHALALTRLARTGVLSPRSSALSSR